MRDRRVGKRAYEDSQHGTIANARLPTRRTKAAVWLTVDAWAKSQDGQSAILKLRQAILPTLQSADEVIE
jgi:hypothetical protein